MESILLKASAGSGKTTRLTEEVFKRISVDSKFIVALTFTRAATTEMRFRIMDKIARQEGKPLLENLRLIMGAGRVSYATMDSFFYRLFAAAGFVPKLADEKEQTELLREIEILFRNNLIQKGRANKLIIAARSLRVDMDTLWNALVDEQGIERCLLDMERLNDLDRIMKQKGVLENKLLSLYEKATTLKEQVTARAVSWVIDAMANYNDFISKTVATYSDLKDFKSIGKNINWDEKPYAELNDIFQRYRDTAEQLAVKKALLRELTVAYLCEFYLEAAAKVKEERGLIFFNDVRRGLLEVDGVASTERPKLMSSYFSLGLDRTEHLLIDEFQDTSKSDIEILMPLIEEILSGGGEYGKRSFFAVGDWKQMIYGWRGADREALEAAVEKYIRNGEITEKSLEYNYRSTPLLVSFFNELVGNLFEGREKTERQRPWDDCKSFNGITEVNCVELEKDGNSEETFYSTIVEYLKKKKAEYECFWGDMAVLALTNNHVQKIEAELLKNEVGVSAVKGRQLLSTAEGVGVMFFIAAVLGKDDKSDFMTKVTASPFWKDVFGNVEDIRETFARKFPRPYGIMAVSCAIESLRGKLPATILDVWQEELQAYFNAGGSDVDGFLKRTFNLRFNIKVPEAENSEYIKVDTIHGTKGLQFKHVFVFWKEEEKESPLYLESEKCHVRFSKEEINCLSAGKSAIIKEIMEKRAMSLMRMRRERANVFYVAVTRAMQTLTVFLPKSKNHNYKPVHQAVLDTFNRFASGDNKKEIYFISGKPDTPHALTIYDVPTRYDEEPKKYEEIDPALLSANIKNGIKRGERLHRWLARVFCQDALPPAGELNVEEYETVVRFVKRDDVFPIMFRPGKIYIEQQISDRENFGIVDRMIVSDNLVTIIDYKSGSMKGLRQKYEEQLQRYTKIMKTLYPMKKIEYYVLSIDV